jgi:hypothetical protein
MTPDDGEQHVAALERILDVLAEIEPERDRIDVHEHLIRAVMSDQAVKDAPCDRARVVPAIGEDDRRHAALRSGAI